MQALGIVLLCLAAAVAYGILHDLVTAHVCVEYFSVFHPRLIDSDDPVVLALFWGVVATWWVGLPLGAILAAAARAGSRPQWPVGRLVRPVGVLLAVMAAAAACAGGVGYWGAVQGATAPPAWIAERIPAEKHAAFVGDWWAHDASYAAGILGGLVLAVRVWRRRGRQDTP